MKETKLLIGEILSSNIKEYDMLDGFVMPLYYFASIGEYFFTLDEIKNVANLKQDKLVIVRMDKVIEEDDLQSLKDTLEFLNTLKLDYIMFSDFAVLEIAKELKMKVKLIYSNSKMLASFEEVKTYNDLGMLTLPSTELTLEEIKGLNQEALCLKAFGYLDIFYSKRKLLSLFSKHDRKILRKDFKDRPLLIKEEKRNDYNLIYENNNGTFIFSSFVYSMLKEINDFNPKFYFLSPLFIDKDIYRMVISLYRKTINEGYSEKIDSLLNALIENIDSGFMYLDSKILLEEKE